LLAAKIYGLFSAQLNAIIGAALIDHLNVGVLVLHDFVLDRRIVPVLEVVFDLAEDLRVLREHLAHQELLRQRECFYFCRCNVHELGFHVVAQVVVTEEIVAT